MIRCKSNDIYDFGLLKLKYWDNSALLMNSGYPVGVMVGTLPETEWLTPPAEEEKTFVEQAMSTEDKDWSALTIPSPVHYVNHKLFFVGHLDKDNIMPDIVVVLPPLVTDELTDSFGQSRPT